MTTAPDPTVRAETRDWIAVDQLLNRLLSAAPDDFEREAIRLAADASGGPDPTIPGGGQPWKTAVADARAELHGNLATALTPQPDDHDPGAELVTDLLAAISAAIRDTEEDTISDLVTAIVGSHLIQVRAAEEHRIANWLLSRADRHRLDGEPDAEQALATAAAHLRRFAATPTP